MVPQENSCFCQICNGEKIEEYNQPGYFKCLSCGGVFVYPLRSLDSYINNTDYLSNVENYLDFISMKGNRWLLDEFERSYFKTVGESRGEMLEIGSALGHFMYLSFARGWEVEGLETSPTAVEYTKKNFKLDVTNKPFEHFETNKKYNAFVMVEVLEHFRDFDPFLKFLKNTAAEQSLLFGTTPNVDSQQWKEKDNIYDINDHLYLFGEKSIRLLFEKISSQEVEIKYFGGEYEDAHIMYAVKIDVNK